MTVRLRGPDTRVLVRVDRAEFLGDLVQEIVAELTDRKHANFDEIVATGIVKNHYIGQIVVRFLVDTGSKGPTRQIAEVSLQIDWERFRINVAGLGPAFEIAPDAGKIEQLSAVLVRLLAFISDYRERTRARTEIVFHWAPGVDSKQASAEMNTRQAESFEWLGGAVHSFSDVDPSVLKAADMKARDERELEYEIAVTPELLDELRVVARFTDEGYVGRFLAGNAKAGEKE